MTDTPRTNEALAALLDRDGELSEENAPDVLVTLCKAMEREREEALADAAMWKANHDNQVSLKSMLMDRPDLGDRALRIAELIRERDEAREALETGGLLGILDRAGHNRAEAIRERDEIRAQLREEQQLHVQTLNERDEARQWESQALVARIQRDQFSKTLGEVREILCNAMPNENQLTSSMAVTLVKERDEAREIASWWRDNWKKGRTVSMIASIKLPWENARALAQPGAQDSPNTTNDL